MGKGGKWALVTGASKGIGREISKLLASKGCNLVVTARSAHLLEALEKEMEERYGVEVDTLTKDLSLEGSAQELFREIVDRGHAIDILVNNAGSGVQGMFLDHGLETDLGMMRLDGVSPVILLKLFVPQMARRGNGMILNVASTGAFQPVPLAGLYAAMKSAILHLSEVLAEELRGSGVTVTVLCPEPTNTEFFKTSGWRESLLMRIGMMDVESVARAGVEGMMAGKGIVIPGILNRFLVLNIRISPRFLVTRVARILMKPLDGRESR